MRTKLVSIEEATRDLIGRIGEACGIQPDHPGFTKSIETQDWRRGYQSDEMRVLMGAPMEHPDLGPVHRSVYEMHVVWSTLRDSKERK